MRKKSIITGAILVALLTGIAGSLVIMPAVPVQAQGAGETEPTHGPPPVKPEYTLEMDLSWELHTLDVKERVTVANRTSEAWDRLSFSVPPAAQKGVFKLDASTLAIGHAAAAVTPVIRGSIMSIVPPQPVKPGEQAVIDLRFRLLLKKLAAGAIHPEGNQGYSDDIFQCGDFFPTLTPYEPGRGFREWQYARVGDPYIYPLADYNVAIRARVDVTVAAAGLVSQKDLVWSYRLENVRSFAFTASPSYRRESRTLADGVTVACYFLQGHDRAGQVMLDTAAQCVELYSGLFGPYPYRELVLAQNGYNSAMEYSAFITVTDGYVRNYNPKQPQLLLFIIAHEISHQWWYGAVGSDQVLEPWLDESLAKYSEYLYFRAYHPALAEWWEKRLNSVPRLKGRYIDDSIYDFNNDHLTYSRIIYGMAPAFMRALHKKIGEESFLAFLKDYYEGGRGRFVTAADFFAALGRHTSEDITPLLKEYFRVPPNMRPAPPAGK
jgi:hypothetical protein